MSGWIAFALLWAWGGCCAYSATTDRRAVRVFLGLTWPIIFFFLPGFAAWKRKQAQRAEEAARRATYKGYQPEWKGALGFGADEKPPSGGSAVGWPRSAMPASTPKSGVRVNVQQYMKQMQAAECLMAKVQRYALDIGCTIIPPDEIIVHTAEQAEQLQAFWEAHSCGKKP